MPRRRGPGPQARCRTLVAATLLLLTAGCSGGIRDAQFEDPYIRQLETEPGGWLAELGVFRRYAAVDRAFRLEEEGKVRAAAAQIEAYLEARPDDLRVRAYYLNLLTQLDEPAEVVAQATTLLEEVPGYVPALLARGRARVELGELGAGVEDLVAASRAPTIRPRDRTAALEDAARYTLLRASRAEARGEWADAEAAYRAALALPLDSDRKIEALRGQARAAAVRGRMDVAVTAMEEATALAPGDIALRREAARLATTAGQFEAAAAQLEAVLPSDRLSPPERRAVLDSLVRAYERAGRPGDAADRIEELIRLAPEDRLAALHARAGELYSAAGRAGTAGAHLEAAGEHAGGRYRVEYLRRAAELYRAAGRHGREIAALRAALATAPGDASLRDELRGALVRATRDGRGVDSIARTGDPTTALEPNELTASRLDFAEAYEEAGRGQEAMELYRLLADVEPEGSPAWVTATERLAEIHARRGEHRAAADRLMDLHRAAATRLESRAGRWARSAGDHYAAVGAWAEAATAYREATSRGALPAVQGARQVAVALVEAGAGSEAVAVLESIPEDQRSHQDLRYLATLAREAGDTTRAIGYYRQAASTAPTAADSAAMLRSIGYLQLGRSDSAAAEVLGRAVELEEDPAARLAVARLRLRLGETDGALTALELAPAGWSDERRLARLDVLAEIHAERGDTAAIIAVLEHAAELEPSAYRLNRLGFLYEFVGRYESAAGAFAAAYEVRPSAQQAAQVAYAYRRAGDDAEATTWFERAIDRARDGPPDTAVDLDAMRREVALLTDRLSAGVYISLRSQDGVAPVAGGVTQAGIGSQGGLQLMARPLLQHTSWGDDLDVFGRLFWSFGDGVRIDADSFQGQLGVRYRPPFLPGSALGLERWVALGSLGLDAWAGRLQLSRLLGRPYPDAGSGAAVYASLYGDASHLFGGANGYVLFGEARPGVAVPLNGRIALLPHATLSGYRQSVDGADRSYVEGGPGLGLRLRVPVDRRYTQSHWSAQVMAQYRWGRIIGGDGYDELVLTFVLQF